VIVPGSLFGVIVQQSSHASLERVIGHQLAREAGHTGDRLTAVLSTEREILRSFARQDLMREIRVADIDKRVSLALTTLRNGSPARLDYLVVDRSHIVIAASNPSFLGSPPPWVELADAALSGREGFRGPVVMDTHTTPGFAIATPVPDPDGSHQVIGALMGLFDWARLTAVTREVRDDLAAHGIQTDVLIVGRDGMIIGGSDLPGARDDVRSADWSQIADGAIRDQPDYVVQQQAELLVGRASLGSDFSGWRLLIIEPLSDALAPARRLTTRLAVILALTLAAALLLATLAGRRVVRPLSELTSAIRGLSGGSTSPLHVPVRTQDEVGTLATAFNRMASELDRAQRDLVEAAKFAFVGELAAGVAHEVRTSLGVLRSSAQILERSLPADGGAETVELAGLIRAEVDRLGGVVNDLLSLGRPHALQLETTPISDPIFRAADFVEPQAHEKGIEVVRVPLGHDPAVLCDGELMYQVALNLLVNSIQALEDGGRIDVSIVETRDGYAGFEVRDDGPGIPEEIVSKVFQPFVSAREGGIGLGLTFAKRIVFEHRGRISLDTTPDSGTCFRIELPRPEVTS
jgi:two-component system sensor histidine kinase HydH